MTSICNATIFGMRHTNSKEEILDTLREIMRFKSKNFDMDSDVSDWKITTSVRENINLL